MKVKTKNDIQKLISIDSNNIPDFIDTKKFTHKQIYHLIQRVLGEINTLCVDEVLTDSAITTICGNVNLYIDCIIETSNESVINLEFYDYLINKIDDYESVSLEKELYEISHNLKKFKDHFE